MSAAPEVQLPADERVSLPPPHELPSDVYGFTGRSAELARLDALLAGAAASSAVVISAVSGTAGVGKTALAVHWAHRVADRFPDGQLYVDLRGYDPDQPRQPADVLSGFLRALGVEGAEMPHDLAGRAALFRTLMAGRRMLVVLDNAYAVDQVRPLLPGTGSSFVLVTSRDSLAGLVVRHGARRVDLDLLSPDEGVALQRALLGDRVDAEPEAAAALVERCARLPLALRVAAELAAARPGTSLAHLVAELVDEHRRLDLFDAGADERTAVRGVFSWSCHRLPDPAFRLFRLMGLHPGADVDLYAATALAGADLHETRHLLDVLVRAHLVQEPVPDRFRMHDLLRAYAAERAEDDPEPDRRAALTGLLHHYLSTAAAAMDVLVPDERHRRPRVRASTGPVPSLDTPARARAWLDAERANLIAAAELAATRGWPTQAGYLADTLLRYLDIGAHYMDALTIHGHALRAAQDHGDGFGEATARMGMGSAYYWLGRYDEAADHYRQAAAGFRADGDPTGETRALTNLGIVYSQWGRNAEALDYYRRALTLFQEMGDRAGEALALGWVGFELGRLDRYDEAIVHLRQSVTVLREMGSRMREAEVLCELGLVLLWSGRLDEALERTEESRAIGVEIGDRFCEVAAQNGLGEIRYAMGHYDEALASHRAALDLARELDQLEEQARALHGIARVRLATGRADLARQHWSDALALYAALQMPQADEVRAHLAALDEPTAEG
jgi:tetratricopeptide (TPR) repeat protein